MSFEKKRSSSQSSATRTFRCPAGWDADERECRHGRTPQSLTTRLCGPKTNLVAAVDAIEVERRIGSDAIVLRGNMTPYAPFQDRWLMTSWGHSRVAGSCRR